LGGTTLFSPVNLPSIELPESSEFQETNGPLSYHSGGRKRTIFGYLSNFPGSEGKIPSSEAGGYSGLRSQGGLVKRRKPLRGELPDVPHLHTEASLTGGANLRGRAPLTSGATVLFPEGLYII